MSQTVQLQSDQIKLGEIALQAGDYRKALTHAIQELQQNPYSKEAFTLAGRVMQALGNWENAASYYLNALRFDPFYRLPNSLFLEHYVNAQLEGYDALLINALNRIPDHTFAIDLLLNHYYGNHDWEKIYAFVDRVVTEKNVPVAFKCKAALMWTLGKFINGCDQIQYLAPPQNINDSSLTDAERQILIWVKTYHTLISRLSEFKTAYPQYYQNSATETLYVVGESHALSCTHLAVTYNEKPYRCSVKHLIGIKAHHFSRSDMNAKIMMHYVEKMIASIPKESHVLVTIGEIDCRVNEGILPYALARNRAIAEVVDQTVQVFVKTLSEMNSVQGHHITLCTVPPLNQQLVMEAREHFSKEMMDLFPRVREVIRLFNRALSKYAEVYHFKILDTYTSNMSPEGFAESNLHIDNYHLKPSVFVESFKAT